MLAICSDLDETPTAEDYFAISEYLNTTNDTPIGRGVGLEVGNTLFFHMAPGEFAYFSANERDRAKVRELIRSGHVDCFHSYGDLADSRSHAEMSLEELDKHGLRMKVWVDHAVAPTNFGQDIMQGYGDEPSHSAYHADLTINHGVKYVWLGRVTSCIGQNVPYSGTTGLRAERSIESLVNAARDAVKLIRGSVGEPKYAMHAGNRLTRPYRLRDGSMVTEFIRCNPHPRGVSVGDHAQGFGDSLNAAALRHLIEKGGVSIIYSHLGKKVSGLRRFPESTRLAFERLSLAQESGDLLVASTVRLLDYMSAKQALNAEYSEGHLALSLPEDLSPDGLTWRWQGPTPVVTLNGKTLRVQRRESAGQTWLGIPWPRLTHPLQS